MIVTIHTPTNNLQESLDFYQKLNYQLISEENPCLLTDGKAVIEINPDRYARAGIKCYKDSWTEEVKQLKKLTTVHPIENGFLFNDFNGCWIYLIEGNLDLELESSDASFGMTGNFHGLSLESGNIPKSLEIWNALGFAVKMGTIEKGFILLQNEEGFGLSLMNPLTCPHLFFNPSMNFFNGENNLTVIENIRKAGIPIAEEITFFNKEGIVDNIIIRDPGGYGFFLFSD